MSLYPDFNTDDAGQDWNDRHRDDDLDAGEIQIGPRFVWIDRRVQRIVKLFGPRPFIADAMQDAA